MTVKDKQAILDRLPTGAREVLILSNVCGLARDEIASIIGASVEAVDVLMRRAVSDLRSVLASGDLEILAA